MSLSGTVSLTTNVMSATKAVTSQQETPTLTIVDSADCHPNLTPTCNSCGTMPALDGAQCRRTLVVTSAVTPLSITVQGRGGNSLATSSDTLQPVLFDLHETREIELNVDVDQQSSLGQFVETIDLIDGSAVLSVTMAGNVTP